jgi:hypothetical protein
MTESEMRESMLKDFCAKLLKHYAPCGEATRLVTLLTSIISSRESSTVTTHHAVNVESHFAHRIVTAQQSDCYDFMTELMIHI